MSEITILQLSPTANTRNESAFALKIGQIRNLLLFRSLKINTIDCLRVKDLELNYRAEVNNNQEENW